MHVLDGGQQFKDAQAQMAGPGFGAQIDCDQGQIRVYDPSSISYYIEGYNHMGVLICGNASPQGPYVVGMDPDAPVLPTLPGMQAPKECTPCPPWDPTCGSTLPQEGQPCTPGTGCAQGLLCGDAGICDVAKEKGDVSGPSKFYINIGGGSGFGIMSQKINFGKVDQVDAEDGVGMVNEFSQVSAEPSGAAWAGIPLRLMIGFHITEKLSIEVTGRFDVKVDTVNDTKSCKEALKDSYGEDWVDELPDANCTEYPSNGVHPVQSNADKSVALTDGGGEVQTAEKMIAWLVNARVRYRLLQKGGLHISIFGGLGYGKIKYRIAAGEDTYFPMPAGVNVEIGPALAFYFNNHVGIMIEVPIDLVVIDGWALNFDLFAGLSFGF